MSYDGADDLDSLEKVKIVKQHVKNVQDMMDMLKVTDSKGARMEADMNFERRWVDLVAQTSPLPTTITTRHSGGGNVHNGNDHSAGTSSNDHQSSNKDLSLLNVR